MSSSYLFRPTVETLGVRLLRSLMSCTESQLGHTFQNAALVGMRGELDLCFQLQSIVGRGGFATVFEASISDKVVAIKKATRTIADKSRQHILQIAHMNREVTMLKLLQYCNTTTNDVATLRVSTMCHSSSTLGDERHQGHFPSLLFNDWICDDSQPYIPLVPLGVPLVLYASGLSKAARKKEAILLRQHLNESLKAANLLGYCHCDLRPDNVIYSQSSTEFIIIDWGLGCEINSACHH